MSGNLSDPFPTRIRKGEWQVLVSAGTDTAHWVDCEKEDAPLLKNAKVLFDHALSGTPNPALVDQLNRTADVLANYGFSEEARLWKIEANNVRERLQKDDLG